MIKNIKKIVSNYRFSMFILILGYFASILIFSIGISIINNVKQQSLDDSSGANQDLRVLSMVFSASNVVSEKNISEIILSERKSAEIQVLSNKVDILELDAKNENCVFITYDKQPKWHIPILLGRYFKSNEILNGDRVVIVGKSLYNKLPNEKKLDKSLTINNLNYKIIGVVGRANRKSQWDDLIYIPFQADHQTNDFRSSLQLSVRENNKKNDTTIEIIKKFQNVDNNLLVVGNELVQTTSTGDIYKSIKIISFMTLIVLIVSIINVINLSLFRIIEKKRDIAIKKILGATNNMIMLEVIVEMVFIAIISFIIAIAFQYLLNPVLNYLFNIDLEVSIFNVILSFLMALFSGIISGLSLSKHIFYIDSSVILKDS